MGQINVHAHHFTAAVCGILSTIEMTGLKSVAPIELADRIPTDEQKEQLRKQVKAAVFGAGSSEE